MGRALGASPWLADGHLLVSSHMLFLVCLPVLPAPLLMRLAVTLNQDQAGCPPVSIAAVLKDLFVSTVILGSGNRHGKT